MIFKKWDIVLVPFPFTNLKTLKKRPALILSPQLFNEGPHVVIMFITSNISSFGRAGDCKLQNWKESGLPKPSMVRMKFATIEKSLIIKRLGTVYFSDQKSINQKLELFFDL